MKALDRARLKAKKAIESMYEGKCTIYEYQSVKNPKTRAMETKEVAVYESIPCRLSYSSASVANQSSTTANITQSIKIFLSPEFVIKPGSKISVMQNGRITDYKQSGQPAVYASHQEINLELYEEHA